ncbi:Membrane protein [Sulfitobacter donghicola DSW-25 = KCTC 12864 = JCM 14565]|nr:Membrane protein [Sulfitobacter donghicola DSW-25 = KCTC 12864 = JCM 14565]
MENTPQISPLNWLAIATLGFTWGGTFLVTEIALAEGMPPFWLAASRISFAAILMGVVWLFLGLPLFEGRPSAAVKRDVFILGGISSTIPFALIAWGQQFVTAGFAGVSMASIALIVLPLAHVFIPGERMTPRRALGFLIGFGGVVILIGSQAFESSGNTYETPGRIACVLAASCYAIGSIIMRRLPPVHPIGLATVLLIIGAVMIIPLAWATARANAKTAGGTCLSRAYSNCRCKSAEGFSGPQRRPCLYVTCELSSAGLVGGVRRLDLGRSAPQLAALRSGPDPHRCRPQPIRSPSAPLCRLRTRPARTIKARATKSILCRLCLLIGIRPLRRPQQPQQRS